MGTSLALLVRLALEHVSQRLLDDRFSIAYRVQKLIDLFQFRSVGCSDRWQSTLLNERDSAGRDHMMTCAKNVWHSTRISSTETLWSGKVSPRQAETCLVEADAYECILREGFTFVHLGGSRENEFLFPFGDFFSEISTRIVARTLICDHQSDTHEASVQWWQALCDLARNSCVCSSWWMSAAWIIA